MTKGPGGNKFVPGSPEARFPNVIFHRPYWFLGFDRTWKNWSTRPTHHHSQALLYFTRGVRPSPLYGIWQNKTKWQYRIVIATGRTVVQAEGIMDDTHVQESSLIFLPATSSSLTWTIMGNVDWNFHTVFCLYSIEFTSTVHRALVSQKIRHFYAKDQDGAIFLYWRVNNEL